MFNHAPNDYACPFCLFVQGGESKYNSQHDIVYQDELVTAFVSPRWWPNNPGNVIIVPHRHYEYQSFPLLEFVPLEKRIVYAERLREYFSLKSVKQV